MNLRPTTCICLQYTSERAVGGSSFMREYPQSSFFESCCLLLLDGDRPDRGPDRT
jgi:hypothetical protein